MYDGVGNRLRQETHKGTNLHICDDVNRLIEVDGVSYSRDANGDLINDREKMYAYDHANRLIEADRIRSRWDAPFLQLLECLK